MTTFPHRALADLDVSAIGFDAMVAGWALGTIKAGVVIAFAALYEDSNPNATAANSSPLSS